MAGTSTLYLLKYNNYFNRFVKKEEDLNGYLNYAICAISNYNFNPNDHISTECILNIEDNEENAFDYIVEVDESGNMRRWYLIEMKRKCAGQWICSFYRDVIVDYLDIIKESPVFVEKAIVPNTDPAIFNSENMSFNQIKKSETAIKDKTGCSWLVAYIDQKTTLTGNVSPVNAVNIEDTTTTWKFKDFLNPNHKSVSNFSNLIYTINLRYKQGNSAAQFLQVQLNKTDYNSTSVEANFNRNTQTTYLGSRGATYTNEEFNSSFDTTYNEILNYTPTAAGLSDEIIDAQTELENLDGQTIHFTDTNRYAVIKVNKVKKNYRSNFNWASGDLMYRKVQSLWSSIITEPNPQYVVDGKGEFFVYSFDYYEYSLALVDYTIPAGSEALNYNIPTSRVHLEDAPYDMICAPYEDIQVKLLESNIVNSTTKNILQVFTNMAKEFAGEAAALYDIQRLPYCPIYELKTVNGVLDATAYNGENQAYKVTQGSTDVGVIFACYKSNFKTTIPLETPITITNTKIQSMCDVYRICSPNYNGTFELDVAMNNGLNGFNIYCSYKPYNPYIQVSPQFGGLYGENFDDARGLICGGEWSLPIVTSAWETYERQNANYNNIFNRQIENMRVQNKYQKLTEWVSLGAGTLSGAAYGGAIGGTFGGLAGGIGAGIGGALTSMAGGLTDIYVNNKLREEALDYTQDLFGYQLGNIQALPNSLARVSAFTVNNKIFPFFEYYTCTEEEKIALANKIAYNGMTVMRIGKISDFIQNSWSYKDIVAKNYIKAKTIRIENIIHDTHLFNTISDELNKGMYFEGENI